MASAFFYGILMHPKILKRVLHNDASHLQICPAILTDYARHQVSGADYPGILPSERSKALLGRKLTPEENCTQGTLVTGLTNQDIMLLDVFEGNEYIRKEVHVHAVGRLTAIPSDAAGSSGAEGSLIQVALPPLPSADKLAPPIPAQTYVWRSKDSYLEKELWSFDKFVQNNAHKWIGPEAKGNEDYEKVDVVKEGMNGVSVSDEVQS